jgi:hypothetical protein
MAPEQARSILAHLQGCLSCQTLIAPVPQSGDLRGDEAETPDGVGTPCQRPSDREQRTDFLQPPLIPATGEESPHPARASDASQAEQQPIQLPATRNRRRLDVLSTVVRVAALVLLFLLSSLRAVAHDANQRILHVARAEAVTHLISTDRVLMSFSGILANGSEAAHAIVLSDGHGPAASALPAGYSSALAAAAIALDRPLSVIPLIAWQNAHSGESGSPGWMLHETKGRWLVLTAMTSHGPLRRADVMIDPETDRVLATTLTLADVGTVEIVDANRVAWLETSAARADVTPSPAAVAVARPGTEDLDRAELSARLLLAQTGLDMASGGLNISRTQGLVRVAGVVVLPDQRHETAPLAELQGLEHVRVELDTHGSTNDVDSSVARARGSVAAAFVRPGLTDWTNRTFSQASTRKSFLPDLGNSVASVRRRLAILDALAERYPETRVRPSATQPMVLQQLLELHYMKLRIELNDLRPRLAVLAGSASVVSPTSTAPPKLMARASAAYSRAARLEQDTRALLAQRDLRPADQRRLREEFERLWESVHGSRPTRH